MKSAAILALVSLCGATDASAHDTGRDVERTRVVWRDFGDCLVRLSGKTQASARAAFLADSPLSPEASKSGQLLAANSGDCLKSRDSEMVITQLKMQSVLLRGIIYRAAFERVFARRPTPALSPDDKQAAWYLPANDPFRTWQLVGECAVRTDPAAARAAIEAAPGGSNEAAAYGKLVLSLRECMPAAGSFRFSKVVLEALMAEALYNLTAGPKSLAEVG